MIENLIRKKNPLPLTDSKINDAAKTTFTEYPSSKNFQPKIIKPTPLFPKFIKRPASEILNPTAELLNNEQGFSFSEKEPQINFRWGSIGSIQGHDQFRKHVAEITKKDFRALSPKALRENREINPLLSLKLTAKRLGHALSLRNNIILENNEPFLLEGFHEVFTLPMLADSFEQFSLTNPHLIDKEMAEWVLQFFTQTTQTDSISDEEIDQYVNQLKDPNFEGPLCVSTGHDWHSIHLIFYRYFVFSMNRGGDPFNLQFTDEDMSQNLHGVNIFMNEDTFNFSSATAKKIFRRMMVNHGQAAHINNIQKELRMHYLDNKSSKSQSVGNCTYVNAKLAVLTLLALYSLRNHEKIITPDFDKAFEDAKLIYKEWVKFDRNYVVKDLLEEIKNLSRQGKKDSSIYNILLQLLQFVRQKAHKLDADIQSEIYRSSL